MYHMSNIIKVRVTIQHGAVTWYTLYPNITQMLDAQRTHLTIYLSLRSTGLDFESCVKHLLQNGNSSMKQHLVTIHVCTLVTLNIQRPLGCDAVSLH